jgi:hypothetical protein
MRMLAIPTTAEDEKRAEQEVRGFLRLWVGLLTDRK